MKAMWLLVLFSLISIFSACGGGDKLKVAEDDGVRLEENLITSCSVSKNKDSGVATIVCPDGSQVDISDGQSGTSCEIEEIEGGGIITCGDDQVVIYDGQDGENGLDAVAEVVDPCGQETSHGLDEILLVLSSGDILAHLDNGGHQHLTFLEKGKTYKTSDGTNCYFEVDEDGKIHW